jgi:hypothetical protein
VEGVLRHRDFRLLLYLIRFALHALLALLIFAGDVEIWHIALIEAAFGTAEAFFRPAYTGLIPQTVPEEHIQPAKAAFGSVETVAEFAGPALFLVSAAFLVRMRPRERGVAAERTTVVAELREGWSEVRRQRWIFTVIAVFSLALLTSFGPMQTVGPTISIEHYDTRAVYGIVASVAGAGTIIGALVGFRWRPRQPMRTGMLLVLLFPLANGSSRSACPSR